MRQRDAGGSPSTEIATKHALVNGETCSSATTQSTASTRPDASERADFTFTVMGRIVPAVRMTQRSKHVSRQAQRYLAYKDRIGWTAREAGAQILSGPISLRVLADVHGRRWDASNVLKGVEDALNGVCWVDDYEITDLHIFLLDKPGRGVDELYITVRGWPAPTGSQEEE